MTELLPALAGEAQRLDAALYREGARAGHRAEAQRVARLVRDAVVREGHGLAVEQELQLREGIALAHAQELEAEGAQRRGPAAIVTSVHDPLAQLIRGLDGGGVLARDGRVALALGEVEKGGRVRVEGAVSADDARRPVGVARQLHLGRVLEPNWRLGE